MKFINKFSCMIGFVLIFIACGDDSSNNSNEPLAENAMESCTVVKNADSTSYTLKCPDGTKVEIKDSAAVSGASCTLKDLEGGSVSLECPDGTKLVFGEDGKIAGRDGASSSDTSDGSSGTSQSAESQGGTSSSSGGTTPSGKTQGYVQFNRDSYTTMADVAQAGIYLFDADNMAKTATVTVYTDSPDTLSVTLDRIDRYFYGKLPLVVYGEDLDKGLWIGDSSQILVEYKDLSTGVAKYDSASVNVSRDTREVSVSFGKETYYDLDDRAVITLRDSRLTDGSSVTVHVCEVTAENIGSRVLCKADIVDIPMYPVEGGNRTERIGFLGFSLDEASGDGVIHVEDSIRYVAFYGGTIREYNNSYSTIDYKYDVELNSGYFHSGVSKWIMKEYCGLTCSKDAKLINGIKYPDKQYVCDGDTIRLAAVMEIVNNKGCTTYNLNEEYGDYACLSGGIWSVNPTEVQKGTFTDSRDGQTYKTVKIGSQTWMAENLNYESEGSYCYMDSVSNCTKYGRLYAGDACPSGWHLPDSLEFEMLLDAVGGKAVAGKMLKSSSGWANSGNGEDAYDFSALPAGGRYYSGFYGTSIGGRDSTAVFVYRGGGLYMTFDRDNATFSRKIDGITSYISVRCIKD